MSYKSLALTRVAQKGSKLLRILRVSAYRRAWLQSGVAAGVEHTRVLQRLQGIATIVDVGANRGQFSLVARSVYPDARIFAFEPLAGAVKVWRRVFADDNAAILTNAALGPIDGQAEIHISARDDSSSLLAITSKQSEIFPGTEEAGIEQIEICRLAHVLSRADLKGPALLKIDVQGFEIQVLEGCEDLLTEFSWVYVECSFIELYKDQSLAGDVICWLRARGFDIAGAYNTYVDDCGRAIQADLLFCRQGWAGS